MDTNSVILVTGGSGMVGSNLVRKLAELGYRRVLAPPRTELNLLDAAAVDEYFDRQRPQHVFLLAARVGGIMANIESPVEFIQQNTRIAGNLLAACHKYRTLKNVLLGSSCIYPRLCPQPIKEEYLLTGPLEPTNEGYALAKILALKLAAAYHRQYGMLTVCPMPCNIYGTSDHFDLQRCHVLSALVKRFEDARRTGQRQVVLWGSGTARREFIHVSDVVDGLLLLMNNYHHPDPINLGSGADVSIRELADLVSAAVGYVGEVAWDDSKPDGMPQKLMDNSRIHQLGFRPQISLPDGIARTVREYRQLAERRAA